MATITTTIAAEFTRTPFVKPPDELRGEIGMPRSIVNFCVVAGVVDAKPVNDVQNLNVTIAVDPTFAYRLVDANVSVIQDIANDWASMSFLEVKDGIRGLAVSAVQRWIMIVDDSRHDDVEIFIAQSPDPRPTYIIQARPETGVAPTITFKATNRNAAVGAAGTCDALFTFFEYEVEQAQHFAVNVPFPPLHYAR